MDVAPNPLADKYRAILRRYLPPSAVGPIYQYLDTNKVQLKITRERLSKLGDYRAPRPGHLRHEISINGDLNPYLFLWVLLHEMAHLDTHLRHRSAVPPHGPEWQAAYQTLLRQYLAHFPDDTKPAILQYLAHPAPTKRLEQNAERALLRHDRNPGAAPTLVLNDLPPGTHFQLASRPSLRFLSIQKRRTRWRCLETNTRREYLIAGNAPVTPTQQ